MTDVTQSGFTIIEVMLFLAISALVFGVGFAGIGSRLDSVRYTDAVRNLESDVETVLRNTVDGVNLRSSRLKCTASGNTPIVTGVTDETEPGQERECAVAGVDIEFDTANPEIFKTRSLAVVTGQYNGGEFKFFTPAQVNNSSFSIDPYLVNAAAIDSTENEYDLLWGLNYTGFMDSNNNLVTNGVTIRYIRSPISTQTYTYWYRDGATPSVLTNPLDVCFVDQDQRSATLTFAINGTVKVAYQNGECSS